MDDSLAFYVAIPLTAAQRAFGVDPVLVHLASLCVRPGRVAPFTKEEDNTFARAQLAYHAAVSGAKSPAPRLFKLTPLLVPPPMSSDANEPAIEPQPSAVASPEARAAAAEARAAAAEAELLAMLECEEAAAVAAAARKAAKKRIAQADPTKKPTAGVTDERSQLAAGTARTGGKGGANACRFVGPTARATALETLDELTAARGAALGEIEYRAEEWTVVNKAPAPRRAHRVTAPPPSAPPSAPPSVPPRAPTNVVAAKAEAEAAPAAASSDAASAPVSEATEQAEQHLRTPTCPQHMAPSWALGMGRATEKGSLTAMPAAPPPAAPSAVPPAGLVEKSQPSYLQRDDGPEDGRHSLLRQIHELRNALRERESAHEHALASAHAAHQVALESALRAAQERAGMRLQALQLRLYIADTRVQTLEEACAQLFTKDDRPLPNSRHGVLGGGAEADQSGALSTELEISELEISDLEISELEIPPRCLRADAQTLQAMQSRRSRVRYGVRTVDSNAT